ncbi:MAG: acyl-ACP--UDP-N-acetylglucosamine O-acyltransferase [Synergistaceae bacterium]|jgi:UDP-N-acetylglucosamine acyltransferase|nr:acyl-ACP--UDP-N-acetylglucosamine O-acyltransferase [Synergistaceae bacterium]
MNDEMGDCVIHPSAILSPLAELGCDVRIGPCVIVDSGAKIGDGSVIEPFVHVTGSVEIGKNCHIFQNSTLGEEPQDRDFGGEDSFVRIGDDVTIRENVTINRATGEGGETSVGDGTMIMEGCHLGHNVKIGCHCTITNKVGFSGHVTVGDYVVVGGMTGFHQFVSVGCYAMVGGMSKVTKDIPPYSLADGRPARIYGLNVVGLRRRGFSSEQRARIKNIYKLLYDKRLSRSKAISLVEESYPGDELAGVIAAFSRSLRRGLSLWAGKSAYSHERSSETSL